MTGVDLKYWRSRPAIREHSGSLHVELTTAQFAAILDELEEARAALADREKILAAAQRAGSTILTELHEARALLLRLGVHQRSNPRCDGWSRAECTCGLTAALEPCR